MKEQFKEIEIPFGVKDSELCGWEYTIPDGMEATIVDNKIVVKKKESEDERIRKELLNHLKEASYGKTLVVSTLDYKIWADWLKKQGEPTEINPSEFDSQLNRLLKQFESLPKEDLASSLSFYLNVVQNDGTYKEEKQGEQKSYASETMNEKGDFDSGFTRLMENEQKPADKFELKFKVGDLIKLSKEPKYPAREIISIKNDGYYFDSAVYLPFERQDDWELVGQKPTAWSEEDESLCMQIEGLLKVCLAKNLLSFDLYKKMYDLLKSLKDRVVPQQQEWSEEDKKKLLCICAWIKDYPRIANFNDEINTEANNYVNWLKSIKPQPQWKPSDEQMGVIEAVINNKSFQRRHLDSLYEQLKKLREE